MGCGGFGRDFPNDVLLNGEDWEKTTQKCTVTRSLSNFEQSGMSNPMFSIDVISFLCNYTCV